MGYIAIPPLSNIDDYQVVAITNENVKVQAIGTLTTKNFKEKNGVVLISGLQTGVWIIRIEKENHSIERSVSISDSQKCQIIHMFFNIVPDFTYENLTLEIVDDNDNLILGGTGTISDWKIRITGMKGSSGSITFYDLKGQYIDIFLVGGGGHGGSRPSSLWGASGGGGGYTKTLKNLKIEEGIKYTVTIAGALGTSSFISDSTAKNPISVSAKGGQSAYQEDDAMCGGNGGSGGGAGFGRDDGKGLDGAFSGDGGTNGSDGGNGREGWWYANDVGTVYSGSYGGEGQGYTTREFEDYGGSLYSPGGAGGYGDSSIDGIRGSGLQGANSGAGGSGTNSYGWTKTGSSGIVIIRNSRGQYGFG